MYLTDIWFKSVIRDQNKYFDTNYRHFRHWKTLSCHDLGYQMSIFFLNLYIKLKPLISSLLWSLDHENILFHSKVIHIKLLKNTCPGFTCPGFRPSRYITLPLVATLTPECIHLGNPSIGRIDSPVNYGYLFTWITREKVTRIIQALSVSDSLRLLQRERNITTALFGLAKKRWSFSIFVNMSWND